MTTEPKRAVAGDGLPTLAALLASQLRLAASTGAWRSPVPENPASIVITAVRALAGAGLRFALFGGWGVAAYGHVRGTLDVDLLVEPGGLDAVASAFSDAGATVERPADGFLEVRLPGGEGMPLHITEASGPLAQELLDTAVRAELDGEAVPVLEPHEIVVSKLMAEREDDPERHAKDLGDIRALTRLGHIDRERLRELLVRRAGEDEGARHYVRFEEITTG